MWTFPNFLFSRQPNLNFQRKQPEKYWIDKFIINRLMVKILRIKGLSGSWGWLVLQKTEDPIFFRTGCIIKVLKVKGGYKRQEVWPNISMCPKLAAFSLLHQKQRYWEHKLLLSDETYMKMFISTVCISLIGCISSQANSFW